MSDSPGPGTIPAPAVPGESPRRSFRIVALVGPPNSGKSTLFNQLTGLRQKVANFPGVTVEHRLGVARLDDGREVELVDLPGIYGLSGRSEDEKITLEVLQGRRSDVGKPDAVLLVLDSTHLQRQLLLAAPILSLGLPTLVILNMADELHSRKGQVDPVVLGRRLGASVALVSAVRGEGLLEVRRFLSGVLPPPGNGPDRPIPLDLPECREWAFQVRDDAGYRAPSPPIWTQRLDRIFLHPVLGPAIFLVVVVVVFQTIFTAAVPLMEGLRSLLAFSGRAVAGVLPDSWVRSLLIEGVWDGVGAVVAFLPQILLLFLFIGVLEDTGYLARAALISDRTMARVGLQGKSFIPLLSAYACAVPAIMATRTIPNQRDRMATLLIAPFMTCSARLPVYTLLIAAFIPDRPVLGAFLGARAATLLGLYLLGFLAAIFTAAVLKSTILRSSRSPFVLEMPPYRWPTLRSIGLRLVERTRVFLRRAGTVILAVTVGLWVLAHVPLHDGKFPPIEESVAGTLGRAVEPVIRPLGFNWKIGIGLVTSLAAREVIVGTLGTIYGMEGSAESRGLQAAVQKDLTLAGAVALLVFFAFAMQCMSTLAVVRRETAGWKWPAIQFAYMTGMAYLGAFVAFRLFS